MPSVSARAARERRDEREGRRAQEQERDRYAAVGHDVAGAAPPFVGLGHPARRLAAVAEPRRRRPQQEEGPEQSVGAPAAGRENEKPGDRARDRPRRPNEAEQASHDRADGDVDRQGDAPTPPGKRSGRRRPRPDQGHLVDRERGRQSGDDVVVDARRHGLQERVDPGAQHQDGDGVGLRLAGAHEEEHEDGRGPGDGPVRQQADPGLAGIPRERRAADGPAGDGRRRIAKRHHGPHGRGDGQVRPLEHQDQQQDHGRVRDDPGVVPAAGVAVDRAPDPGQDEEVEQERGEGEGGRGLPVEPAQRQGGQAEARVNGLASPLRGRHEKGSISGPLRRTAWSSCLPPSCTCRTRRRTAPGGRARSSACAGRGTDPDR